MTLNPAIDKLLVLNKFEVHKLHRLEEDERSIISPGGKGVNIALNVKILGQEVIATVFAGEHAGHMLCDNLRQRGITTSFIFTKGSTRTNTSILDIKNETLTEINDFGQVISKEDMDFFMDNYHLLLHRVDCVVIAGSLPRGVPDDIYRQMVILAKEHKLKVLVHTSPAHTDSIIGTSPFLINPDMRSYHELMGKPLDGIDQFIQVGKELLIKNRDTEYVIFTHRIENVVAVTRDKSFVLRPRNLKIVNMLGYGDAYLAGFIHGCKSQWNQKKILRYASSAGLTNVESLYKEFEDLNLIEKNLNRIDIEEIS